MRDIFSDIFENQPADPMESARKSARPRTLKRFYKSASVGDTAPYAVLLDGKAVMTPRQRPLAAPVKSLAQDIAAEWNAQGEVVDPSAMPLTRLANVAIDAVAERATDVADEVARYLGSDLVCYRADTPEGLVAAQARHWDPLLALARDEWGARFVLAEGVMHVLQPVEAVAAAAEAIPNDQNSEAIWQLAAVSTITTLTGSALIALALAQGKIDVAQAWEAAHVDEDWQMSQWGRDDEAMGRRARRHEEFKAAARVLAALRQ